jgi:uracil-DNA glycosylase family 4
LSFTMASASTRQHYLHLMGIDVWQDRELSQIVDTDDAAGDLTHEDEPEIWQTLRKQVASCTQCGLHKGRQQTVFGVGDKNAEWMVIGEAPGAEEDRQGEPFVGRAGKLLNAMLQAIGLLRSQVYIANILKCRPPKNRDPQAEEVAYCEDYLKKQIELIQPKIILCVGRIAAQNLLKVDTPMDQMRGQFYEYPGSNTPVVVTYHPAYLLRSPQDKRKAWQDLQLAMRIYQKS